MAGAGGDGGLEASLRYWQLRRLSPDVQQLERNLKQFGSPQSAPQRSLVASYDFIDMAQAVCKQAKPVLSVQAKLVHRYGLIAREHRIPIADTRAQQRSLQRDRLLDSMTHEPLALNMYVCDAGDLLRELVAVINPNYLPGGRRTAATLDQVPEAADSASLQREQAYASEARQHSQRAKLASEALKESTPPVARDQHEKLRSSLQAQAEAERREALAAASRSAEAANQAAALQLVQAPTAWIRHGLLAASLPQGMIKVVFAVPSVADLRRAFAQLHPTTVQVGIEDQWQNPQHTTFVAHRAADTEDILDRQDLAALIDQCRSGCLPDLRARIWMHALCFDQLSDFAVRYNELWSGLAQYSTLSERLAIAESRFLCNLSDVYFIFQDQVSELLVAFLHDKDICRVLNLDKLPTSQVLEADVSPAVDGRDVPCSGIVLMRGMSLLVAPLAYLSHDMARAYALHRQLYCRYWHRLLTINGAPDGILALCNLFETLMQRHQPELWNHLLVLLVWDRIIGFDSLRPLALLAVAIFAYRASVLLRAGTRDEVDAMLMDLSGVEAIVLLQTLIFV
ncbi:uncharacterized protein MONBRDRAFT_31684 [Monosiga brevicollis MX1]|uniref:Rab-GAP TBC domain-containing protein n=1 Tax=Monosiga brevicollis TaxID=81824 RepID=A9UV61_MONBE|nr:uncharacterized protein MONBRDRAFT_31684 [Monosiga brevicollis MX1]EDQ91025.1 predicted protein [Monosiga brevicollis MX1]|eukprot:XP_001744322.1 hypothetical protein [Monosiga brevicollis MX1]